MGLILLGEEIYHVVTGVVPHLPVYFKFSGILLIIWLALLYSGDGGMRKLLKPIIRFVFPFMKGIGAVPAATIWPPRAIPSLFAPGKRAVGIALSSALSLLLVAAAGALLLQHWNLLVLSTTLENALLVTLYVVGGAYVLGTLSRVVYLVFFAEPEPNEPAAPAA